jgi:CheY-like chemotaxis protein
MMLSQATLLIVEDEPELLEVMAESLGPVANRIVTAINGEAALKALASAGVDAIVTDLRCQSWMALLC